MAGNFLLKVVAPTGQVLNKDVEFVVAPGEVGELGILPNHAPLIASLETGVIRYTENGQIHKIAISGGFLEVSKNVVTIVAHTAELAEQIDLERAEAAKSRAENRLFERKSDTDFLRAGAALKRSIARIKAVK